MVHHSSATAIYWRDLGKVLEIGPWRHQIWETHLERVGADFLFAQITVLYQLYPISRLTCLFAQWGGNAFLGNTFLVFMFLHFWQSFIIKPVFCIMFALAFFFNSFPLRLAKKSAEKYWKNIQAKVEQNFSIYEWNQKVSILGSGSEKLTF